MTNTKTLPDVEAHVSRSKKKQRSGFILYLFLATRLTSSLLSRCIGIAIDCNQIIICNRLQSNNNRQSSSMVNAIKACCGRERCRATASKNKREVGGSRMERSGGKVLSNLRETNFFVTYWAFCRPARSSPLPFCFLAGRRALLVLKQQATQASEACKHATIKASNNNTPWSWSPFAVADSSSTSGRRR